MCTAKPSVSSLHADWCAELLQDTQRTREGICRGWHWCLNSYKRLRLSSHMLGTCCCFPTPPGLPVMLQNTGLMSTALKSSRTVKNKSKRTKKKKERKMSNQSEMWPPLKVKHKVQGVPRGKPESSQLAASVDCGVLQGSGFQPPVPLRIPTWSAEAQCCNEHASAW